MAEREIICRTCDGTGDHPDEDADCCPTCEGDGVEVEEYLTADVDPLDPCPFCGAADAFVERADLSSAHVVCNGCGARGPTECQEDDDEETPGASASAKAWNKRVVADHG